MSRQQRTEKSVEIIASRFILATKLYLKINSTELSKLLGYANPSPIHSVSKGRTLPDFVRLFEHRLDLRDENGLTLNFHWLITGEGAPMIKPEDMEESGFSSQWNDDIYINIKKLKPTKKMALAKFLAEFA